MKYHYVWFLWASAFLVPWGLLYVAQPAMRRQMIEVSAATSLLGLTEPLFVPEYWNPPTLFELAQRTGFDIESLIFCFAIGGIAAVLYNGLARRRLMPWNPIYPGIVALALGSADRRHPPRGARVRLCVRPVLGGRLGALHLETRRNP